MVELYINNVLIELEPNLNYTHIFQVNTIGDPSNRQTNFVPRLDIPRTEYNTKQFDYLGLTSDVSSVPYSRLNVMININTVPIMYDGYMTIVETTEDTYKCQFFDGVINFFKIIDNQTLGEFLDLTEIQHEKTIANIQLTQVVGNTKRYCYIFGDWGGLISYKNSSNQTFLNIDHLSPSVEIKYLIEKIQLATGYTFEGSIFSNQDYLDMYLTYSKNTAPTGDKYLQTKIVTLNNNPYSVATIIPIPLSSYFSIDVNIKLENFYEPDIGHVTSGDVYLRLNGFIVSNLGTYSFSRLQRKINIIKNDINLSYITTTDVLDILIQGISDEYGFLRATINTTLYDLGEPAIDFTDSLKSIKINDFLKELMNRFSLTIIPDNYNKKLKFLTLTERINSQVVDWSDKYSRRISETYAYEDYAIQNNFTHKYVENGSSYNDGKIIINDVNLKESSDIIKSSFYTNEESQVSIDFFTTKRVNTYPNLYFESKSKTNSDGQIEVEYKYKDNRIFFVKKSRLDGQVYQIGSYNKQTLFGSLPTGLYYVRIDGLRYFEYVETYYNNFIRILSDSRIHDIELNLNIFDVHNLKHNALYYFDQEQQYYMLDSINYKHNGISVGTFVRVKK